MKSIVDIKEGDIIRIVGLPEHGHGFYHGQLVEVGLSCDADSIPNDKGMPYVYGRNCYPLDEDRKKNNSSSYTWYVYDGEFELLNNKIKLHKL